MSCFKNPDTLLRALGTFIIKYKKITKSVTLVEDNQKISFFFFFFRIFLVLTLKKGQFFKNQKSPNLTGDTIFLSGGFVDL